MAKPTSTAKATASAKPVAASGKAPAAKKAGTALAVKPAANIVDIQAQLRAQALAMSERTAPPSGSSIRIASKQFKLPNGQSVPELEAIIVDFRATHDFYEGAFDPKAIQPPICFSIATNPKDMVPSDNSPKKQNDSCQSCPMNQFGSDGNGKACKEGRKLALLPTNESGDDVDPDADMWTLKVSPTALKGFDGYVQSLARTFSSPPVGFITTIGFDENVDYAKLVFSNPRPIMSVADAFARQGEAKDMLEAEPDVSGFTEKSNARGVAKKPVARR